MMDILMFILLFVGWIYFISSIYVFICFLMVYSEVKEHKTYLRILSYKQYKKELSKLLNDEYFSKYTYSNIDRKHIECYNLDGRFCLDLKNADCVMSDEYFFIFGVIGFWLAYAYQRKIAKELMRKYFPERLEKHKVKIKWFE